ncbi:MAG: hypothetical protein U5K79_13195 [Cyclobacteriaceae bacterium]|nr:hypothetical protein [Cyclobacteriaceae bacterium]
MIHCAKPKLVAILMFLGILTGIAVLLATRPSATHSSLLEELSAHTPWVLPEEQPVRSSLQNLLSLWEASATLSALQARDSLSAADSAKIRHIDSQLNQLIHD